MFIDSKAARLKYFVGGSLSAKQTGSNLFKSTKPTLENKLAVMVTVIVIFDLKVQCVTFTKIYWHEMEDKIHVGF